MSLLNRCIDALGHEDAASIAGCYQAHATVQAAYVSLGAGLFAVLAGILGLFAVFIQSNIAARAAKEAERERRRRVALAYLAEMNSLKNFLIECSVEKELIAHAKQKTRWYFDPGQRWLGTYRLDPSSVGAFTEELATDVVSYCCKMINELGVLWWMHNLREDDIVAMTPNGLAKRQLQCVRSLRANSVLCEDILERLRNFRTD